MELSSWVGDRYARGQQAANVKRSWSELEKEKTCMGDQGRPLPEVHN
jgi:hypothetical protein